MSFDWQTEEDNDWDEQAWVEKPAAAVSKRFLWPTFLIVAILIALAVFLLRYQIDKRLEATTAAIEADVLAAHNLLNRAAANRDAALAKTVLSGRDRGWSQVQTELITAGYFFENPGLHLLLPEDTAPLTPLSRQDARFVDLVLNPQLNGVELTFTRAYQAQTSEGLETVTLQQTAVYRQGETRWLYAPPLAEFWGDWQTEALENITVVYPKRDQALVTELAVDLQVLLEDTCKTLPDLACADLGPIQVRFDTDPESLLEAVDPANLYDGNLRLNLPSPTLVGLPIDKEGYEALRNAYGANLVSALIAQSVGYECCRHASLFQAIMTYQLSELDLVAWPVTPQTQAALASGGVYLDSLYPYWNGTDFSLVYAKDSARLFGFVDFLLIQHAPQESPLALMAQMNTTRTFQTWLISLLDRVELDSYPSLPADRISQNWWFYALMASETTVSDRPIAWPSQDLQLICFDDGAFVDDSTMPRMALNRYELDGRVWLEELNLPGIAIFSPLPQDDGVVLQLLASGEDETWRTILWQNSRGLDILEHEDTFSLSLGQVDPDGRNLLYYSDIDEQPILHLADIESCQRGTCTSTQIGYTPYWSPDGRQLLLTERHLFESGQYLVDGRMVVFSPDGSLTDGRILLGRSADDLAEAVEVGQGVSPFWISNELFGFIRSGPSSSSSSAQALLVMSTSGLNPETVVETDDLLPLLPEDARSRSNLPSMRYALPHPTDSDVLLLMATAPAGSENGYIFKIDRDSQTIDLLFQINFDWVGHALSFSPDGRFVVATGSWQPEIRLTNPDELFGNLHLYDLATDTHQVIVTNNDAFLPAFTFDWSQDGHWLSFIRNWNAFGLIAPAEGFRETIVHTLGNCTSLAWIDPLPAE